VIESVLGAPCEAGDELVVKRYGVVVETPASFEQETAQQGVALARGETLVSGCGKAYVVGVKRRTAPSTRSGPAAASSPP